MSLPVELSWTYESSWKCLLCSSSTCNTLRWCGKVISTRIVIHFVFSLRRCKFSRATYSMLLSIYKYTNETNDMECNMTSGACANATDLIPYHFPIIRILLASDEWTFFFSAVALSSPAIIHPPPIQYNSLTVWHEMLFFLAFLCLHFRVLCVQPFLYFEILPHR